MMTQPKSGIETLRHAVNLLAYNREDFNTRFTVAELLQIVEMQHKSGWDFYPDQWSARQIREALQGIPPQWDENERPVYLIAEQA
jgi:hypothetical protein